MSDRERTPVMLVQSVAILVLSIIVAVLSAAVARGQERQPTPSDAVGWALSDLIQLPEPDRPFQRYLWIPPWGNDKWVAAIGLAVNSAPSHALTIQRSQVLANGWMVRYDLRRLAPKSEQLAKLLATWDGLAVDDPYFHVPSSNTKLKAAVIAPHLDETQAGLLAGLSLSAGGLYRADWFIRQALSTLDGGRYYEFRQVTRKPEKGTALDAWLSSRGLFVGTTEAVGGERRAAMFRSGVTGKPRRVDVFPTLSGGVGSITRDVRDGRVSADAHPIRNLLGFRDDGSEVIVALPNGMLDYLLADAKGNIVDEAPPDLVRDHTIPAPHTSRLQPARSCIACHGTEQADGWQPVSNDVARLLGSRLNVFADVAKNLSAEEVADKLAGFYTLDIDAADSMLGRARRDYSLAVGRLTRGLDYGDKKSLVAEVSRLTTQIVYSYDYDLITPLIAARELGYTPAQATTDPLAVVLGDVGTDRSIDPIEGFLRIGVPVNRSDWESVYADLARVAEARRKEVK